MATSSGADDCRNILFLTTGEVFPEERSLRHIIRTGFPNGMPEDSIAIIMRDVLTALYFLPVSKSSFHNPVESSKICVDAEQDPITIKLVADPTEHSGKAGGPAWKEGEAPTNGIWGLGIAALEMGYGSLPGDCNGLQKWVRFTDNMTRVLS